ncbi:MAG: lactate/malate family dehydrogenase [Tractidigestivibacter sp.]|jgi:L-lactate dehydrogenase|uniref:lactate/malate family dehydrogenase n=1 Tax=Tractidigestivibacter sp. TaxID=2847320 RepID=UPI003D8E6B78
MALCTKIGIIGCNHVGAHVANAILYQGLATEIYLSDLDDKLCRAQVNDLQDAMSFYPQQARVFECDDRYEELAGCDIIVNAAGHVAAAATDRDGELKLTVPEAKKFAKRITDAGFKGVWVSVANPNDVIATEIWQLTGCDPTRVIGSGTTLDSARFKHALADATGYDQASINAWMLGEHGFSEFALWSHVRFGCLTPEEVESQAGIAFDRDDLEMKAVKGGYITMAGKGCTEYSISNGTVKIVAAIVHDSKLITPVSTLLDNVYGMSGHYASLPCVIGKDGVEKVFVPEMTDREVEKWQASCKHIQDNIAKVSW